MSMKTAVSIPDPVFRSADELAARLRISRSELYSRALAAMIDQHRESLITERLNSVYGREPDSKLDPGVAAIQHRSIRKRR
jgi:metal-responsive CopG/Arc/MetJ family transcriptional regulator